MWRKVRISMCAIIALAFFFLMGNTGCIDYGVSQGSKVIPHAITLMISSNTTSNFTPCGCSVPQGGIPRRGTLFLQVEDEVEWPVLFIDTGNVTQGSTSETQKLKDGYIFQAYTLMDYDVVNIGMNELRLGMDELLRIGEDNSIPWISANTYEQGLMPQQPVDAPVPGGVNQPGSSTDPMNPADVDESVPDPDREPAAAPDFSPLFPAYRIVEHEDAPGFRIGFIGAMVHEAARLNVTANFSFEAYFDAIQRQVDHLRDTEKVDLLILVSDADNFDTVVPGTFEGIDIVIGGNMRELSSPNASFNPENPNYRPANPVPGEQPDGAGEVEGETSVELNPLLLPVMFPKAQARGRSINRVDIWLDESGRVVDYWTQRITADDAYEDDTRMAEIGRGYDNDVLSVELTRQVTRLFAGSQACDRCHPGYLEAWESHRHFHSYETIVEGGELDDRSCTECHAVGFYNKPRLLTYDLVPETLRNVGCEGCHENGGTHVQQIDHMATLDPSARGDIPVNDTMSQLIASSRCTECHTGQWAVNFDYDTAMAAARAICQGVSTPGLTVDELHEEQSQ